MLREKPDVLILPGDLTFNGARESHAALIEKLQRISDAGVRVLVLPGNHDLNNPMAARFHGDSFDRVESVTAEEFAEMCRGLHATHVDTTAFECVKDRYARQLAGNPFFTPAEKDRLLRFIQDAPDTDTALHGDLQFGNAIFVGQDRYFIDLGDFSYGYPLFDIGMVYCTAYISEPDFVREAFHMEPATAVRFWQAFAPVYFGKDRPLRDIEAEVRPFAGLKTIIVERDMGRPMPTFREALKPILQP
jgi:3',5'-cyclic AMP phosphodiesterase CpdA